MFYVLCFMFNVLLYLIKKIKYNKNLKKHLINKYMKYKYIKY